MTYVMTNTINFIHMALSVEPLVEKIVVSNSCVLDKEDAIAALLIHRQHPIFIQVAKS